MNKRSLVLSAFMLTISAVLYTGCKKDDEPPTISLNGANPQTVTLQGTYTELGATANDPEDGDITSSILTDASEVDADTKGTYEVHYEVTDSDGNFSDAHRTVNVENSAEEFAGTYAVVDSCGTFPGGDIFNYSQIVTTSDIDDGRIQFNKFADYSNNSGIYADVNGNSISLPTQLANGIGSAGENHSFSGSGQATANGFMIQYVDVNLTAGATATCRAWFTK